MTNSREHEFFVCRDQLCDRCSSVNFWYGGSWPNRGTRRNDSEARRANKNQGRGPSGRVTEAHSPYHQLSSPGQRIRAWREGLTAEPMNPVPTYAAHHDGGRCPLSEAFEHAVRIEGNVGAPAPANEWYQEEEEWAGEDDGVDHVWIRERKGDYGPFMPHHFPSDDTGNRSGGLPSCLGGHGRRSRRTRHHMAANKKRVRFARKTEMVRFSGDSATRTLGSLGREYRACR